MDSFLSELSVIIVICILVFVFTKLHHFLEERKYRKNKEAEINHTVSQIGTTQILETVNKFKNFYHQFGVYPSDEEISKYISEFAMADSEDEQTTILFNHIPMNPKSVDFFNEETKRHIESVIDRFIVNDIKVFFKNSFTPSDYLDENGMQELIDAQKETCPTESLPFFRYNYELMACVFIFTLLTNDAYLNSLTPLYSLYGPEIEESTRRILKYAQEMGYSQINT